MRSAKRPPENDNIVGTTAYMGNLSISATTIVMVIKEILNGFPHTILTSNGIDGCKRWVPLAEVVRSQAIKRHTFPLSLPIERFSNSCSTTAIRSIRLG